MAKGLSSRGGIILGAGRIFWLSQDTTGRPGAQGAESKDGRIIGEPGRWSTAVHTLWTQKEASLWSAHLSERYMFSHEKMVTYYQNILHWFHFSGMLQVGRGTFSTCTCSKSDLTDPHGSTSPSKISLSHFPPGRKWEKMTLLHLAVRQHFSPEPKVCVLGNIRNPNGSIDGSVWGVRDWSNVHRHLWLLHVFNRNMSTSLFCAVLVKGDNSVVVT